MPLPEQRRKINAQFEIMSVTYYVLRMDYSRGARHGQTQWQYDNWKAQDAKRHAERKHGSIVLRKYRNSQISVGWTEKYCRYLDSIASVDISHTATWSERSRYENNLTLGIKMEQNQDQRHVEMIFHEQFARLEPSKTKKDG